MPVLHRIDAAFRNGLANGPHVPANAEVLRRCHGVRPGPGGLEPYRAVESPEGFVAGMWPGLAAWNGQAAVVVATDGGLYTGTPLLEGWSLNPITVKDAGDRTTNVGVVPTGGAWHFADFGPFWILCNEWNFIVHGPADDPTTAYRYTASAFPRTACNLWGRGLIAGFDDSWTAAWEDTWQDQIRFDLPAGLDLGINLSGKSIVWDSILGGALLMWVDPALAEEGPFGTGTPDRPHFVEMLRQNQTGFMDVPWNESVLRLWPTSKGALVFTNSHVGLLYPTGVSFGFRDLEVPGLESRGAVGGNERACVWVDSRGCLWRFSETVERLGYENVLAGAEEFLVSHDEQEGNYFLCTKTAGWGLNAHGLYEIPQSVAAAFAVDGQLRGIVPPRAVDPEGLVVETNTYDLGLRIPKTVAGFRLGARNPSNYRLTLLHRSDAGQDFVETLASATGPDGYAPLSRPVSAIEYRVRIEADDYEGADVDYVEVLGADRVDLRSVVR